MDKLITIYHGSKHVVETPVFGEGRKNNDFGLGFYCTESNDLAKEWAVSSLRDGFSNRYTLDTEFLNVLHINVYILCLKFLKYFLSDPVGIGKIASGVYLGLWHNRSLPFQIQLYA